MKALTVGFLLQRFVQLWAEGQPLTQANGRAVLPSPPWLSRSILKGQDSMSVLQETSPSKLLLVSVHLHERGGIGSPSGPAVWRTFTRREKGTVLLKHHRNQGRLEFCFLAA